MENYYYVSEGIIIKFPELERSKSFKGALGNDCYVAIIPDWSKIEAYISNYKEDNHQFAYECVDSLVDLKYDAIDYDDEDNEIEVVRTLNYLSCKQLGLVTAIDQELGISKEKNVAFVIYKLAEHNEVNPIEFVNSLYRAELSLELQDMSIIGRYGDFGKAIDPLDDNFENVMIGVCSGTGEQNLVELDGELGIINISQIQNNTTEKEVRSFVEFNIQEISECVRNRISYLIKEH